MASHELGCSCRHHLARPWCRPEHWTRAEVAYLEAKFGAVPDQTLARKLGRTVVGIRLKAKRLGLHKRTVGHTVRQVAEIFGTDSSAIGKVWIRHGLLKARATVWQQSHGGTRASYWIVDPADIERFIREHPEWVDVEKMPDSPYRDLAACDPWISLPEVHHRTGRGLHQVALLCRAGEIRGRKRGSHWFVPVADLPLIRSLSPDAIDESRFRRDSNLRMRRNRRKGVAA